MDFKKMIKNLLNEGHHGRHHGSHHGGHLGGHHGDHMYKQKNTGHHNNRYREPQAYPLTQNTLICKSCHFPNQPEHKFCSECGQPLSLVKKCSDCGASISTNSKFCPDCGKRL